MNLRRPAKVETLKPGTKDEVKRSTFEAGALEGMKWKYVLHEGENAPNPFEGEKSYSGQDAVVLVSGCIGEIHRDVWVEMHCFEEEWELGHLQNIEDGLKEALKVVRKRIKIKEKEGDDD